MFLKIFVATALALLGISAFWDASLGGGHILNPFGIMFLLFAALVWFGWQTICGAFKSAKDESNIPMGILPTKWSNTGVAVSEPRLSTPHATHSASQK
jgi:energy-coupling factor transporter transmembrane protein EcfT